MGTNSRARRRPRWERPGLKTRAIVNNKATMGVGVGLVLRLGPVVIAIAAALLVLLNDPDPLPVVVTSITLPGSVPCLPPFLLMANFRYVHVQ